MFDFRNGMLGVVIVTIAIAASIFGSYLAGIESVEKEVIKYNSVADVTGLFSTEQSPQYVDYDPSSNYVGYYSEDSYSAELQKYYFAQNEIGYSNYTGVNNYRLNLQPDNQGSGTLGLDSSYGDEPFDDPKTYAVSFTNTNGHWPVSNCDAMTLNSFIEYNHLKDDGTNIIYLTSNSEYEEFIPPINNNYNADWLLFSSEKMWGYNTWLNPEPDYPDGFHILTVASKEYMDQEGLQPEFEYKRHPTYLPYFSCIVDLNKGYATLCYDSKCLEPGFEVELDKVIIAYNGDSGDGDVKLSDDVNLIKYSIVNEYLDPNSGVWMKDGE